MIRNKSEITQIKNEIFKEQGIKNRDNWDSSLIDKLVNELIKTRSRLELDKLKK